MKSKKGQDGVAVATLVLLIALFIIGYVILLPPQEREELLKQDKAVEPSTNVTGEIERGTRTLLSEIPGELIPYERGTKIKSIEPVNLFSRTDSKLINLATNMKVSANLFQESPRSFSFKMRNLDSLQNLNLFFFVREGKGPLKIEVNNALIFEGKVTNSDAPITIPKDILKTDNIIRLSVGKSLFGNSYELTNLYLKQEFSVENKVAKRTFVLSNNEKRGLNRATLYYTLNCRTLSDQGTLTIFINNKHAYNGYVVCDVGTRSLDIDDRKLVRGENDLMFRISKGDYSIQDIELALDIKEWEYPKYTFNLDNDAFDEIFCEEGSCKNVYLGMLFADDVRKKAALTINEFGISMDTYDFEYYVDITRFLRLGYNVLKIVPYTEFDVDHLSVFVE